MTQPALRRVTPLMVLRDIDRGIIYWHAPRQLTLEQAIVDAEQLAEFMRVYGKVIIVAECKDIEGYDTDARKYWQSFFLENRTKFSKIVLYNAKPVIRMAGTVVCMLIGLPAMFDPAHDQI